MRRALAFACLAVVSPSSASAAGPAHVRHSLRVALDPAAHHLSVTDSLTGLDRDGAGAVDFLLNPRLKVTASEPPVTEVPADPRDAVRFFGTGGSSDLSAAGKLKRYRATLPAAGGTLKLSYEGAFDFGLSDQKEEYTRGFRETAGIVSPEGVYLSGGGFWYPLFDAGLVEYQLEVELPAGWQVVGAGNGTSRDDRGVARWDSHGAVEEITIVGGPLVVHRDAAPVEALVYLHQKDDALASRYLQATAQYIEMYRGLVGPYPYGKFALVENFWETGYGMPSFTLLGPQVIRFPFILTSSYPHEILHNWWGNSVFVDYQAGNWCEGLTAYMADHLLQEQRGRGEEYRRDALARYRSYVKDGRDFPLREFRSRHSAATEAVGYGKALMVFHMLRQRMGDEAFRKWAARFYREYQGRQASFGDLRKTAEAVLGQDLGRFFADHVERSGAARLSVTLSDLRDSTGEGYDVAFLVEQTQAEAPFLLDVPVVVETRGQPVRTLVHMAGRLAATTVRTEAEPLALHVDPSFDVFRLLDPRETAPSIGQIFGEPEVLAVLPTAAPLAEQEAWRRLIEGWRSESHRPEVRTDAEVAELPRDRAVWLLGRTNKLAPNLFASNPDYTLDATSLSVDRERMPLAGHLGVLVRRHPRDPEKAVGWIFADGAAALPGLCRKLPHYGKYSYLGFEGQEPTNVLKGQWPASDSPLRVDLRPTAERTTALPPLTLPARTALAELPPAFSQKALADHVAWLSAPEREGRGLGTRGLDAAADYVAAAFKAAGLQGGGDGGTYFQSFGSPRSPSGSPVTLRNVVGVLPGSRSEWRGQSALLTAHYDHLGFGWPDAHQGDQGRLHPGADDNASGVAALLELARVLASGERPQRTIVFVAFTGEEAGLVGSRYYAGHPAFPLEKAIGVVNLDTVGRLLGKKVSVIATGTASEWPHIFQGASFVTGVESRMISEPLESSDQTSFIERGVPAVQVFTDAHPDYHRPGDTADKVDAAGLVKVATFVKEAVAYLGERPEPLTNTIEPAKRGGSSAAPPGTPSAGARRVSFGTVPDFSFAGPGVRVAGVTPGSPAEKAGVQAGEVLLELDGQTVANLQGFSTILRGLRPGQAVAVLLERAGQRRRLQVTVVER